MNLAKALAEEFGPQGVRVNTILPGPVRTGMWTDLSGPGAAIAAQMGTTLSSSSRLCRPAINGASCVRLSAMRTPLSLGLVTPEGR